MANMEERLETVVTQAETDVSKWHTIVHGDENSTVETENGDVPTVAKQLKDIREAITGGVSDVVAEAESARDEAKSVRDNALTIKNEIEQLKTDTEEATETAKSYKNMAQTTFNSISSAVNKGIADVQAETQNQIATLQTTGDTQVNRTQTAATEQIQLASNQADRAETAAVMLFLRLVGKTMFYNIQDVLVRYRDFEGNTSHRQKEKMLDADARCKCFAAKEYPHLYQQETSFLNRKRVWIRLFGLPVLKVKRRSNLSKTYLFGLFPLFSLKG